METAFLSVNNQRAPLAPAPLPVLMPKLWRDPHTVPPEEIKAIITRLEEACALYPDSPDLRTCLGMAHAVNYDAYRSMDAFEAARAMAPEYFWAQYKFAELLYRLRALPRAEEETARALQLAENGYQIEMARKQLQEVRRLIREGTQKPAWTKPLAKPASWLMVMAAALMLMVKMFH